MKKIDLLVIELKEPTTEVNELMVNYSDFL